MRKFFNKVLNLLKAGVAAIYDEVKITLFGGGVTILGGLIAGLGGLIAISSVPAIIVLAIYGQWTLVIAGIIARGLVVLGLWVFEKFARRQFNKEAQANA